VIARRIAAAVAAVAVVTAGSVAIQGASPALAWEAQTTHAGLAEQAAIASRLHDRLRALGWSRGLYEPLTVPPADAPDLLAALRRLDPVDGLVPDARGRQYALAWIAAGAALADAPFAQHHFFDPATGKGWSREPVGVFGKARAALAGRLAGANLPSTGTPAPDWVVAKDNPLGLGGFLDQYAKAARARTPGERSRHMAAALVAAGSILHVLADVGSPSHVRGDIAAHLDPVGPGKDDLGSRFERIAALAWGRLGVPAPARVVTRPTLRAFFTAADGSGLADVTASRWFSAYTLPQPTRIGTGSRAQVHPALVKPRPAPPDRLNLMAASSDQGVTLNGPDGTCLARYRVASGILSWFLDDDCLLAQAGAILPEVASFSAGLLDFLLRGELEVTITGAEIQVASGGAIGAGDLEILAEDAAGVRTPITTVKVAPATEPTAIGRVALPAGAGRAVAVFRGVDGAGEPLVAVGAGELP
jgi:hypothetical protein